MLVSEKVPEFIILQKHGFLTPVDSTSRIRKADCEVPKKFLSFLSLQYVGFPFTA